MYRYIVILSVATLCFGFPYEFEDFDDDFVEPIYRVRRDMFGGRSSFPNGGFRQNVGFQHGPVFGSVSQDFNRRGFGGPQTFTGGLSGNGLTVGGSKTPHVGSQVFAQGNLPIVNQPNHNANVWVRHENNFNKNGQRMFETNSAGVNYQHGSGATASGSISHTPGRPDTKTFGAGVPLGNGFSLDASRSMTSGQKHNDQIGLNFQKNF